MRQPVARHVALLAMLSALIKRGRFAGAFTMMPTTTSSRGAATATRGRSDGHHASSSSTSSDVYDPPSSDAVFEPRRTFQLVPFGSSAPSGVTTISCDGLVQGSTFEVTHWTNNKTPEDLYADTSTEIAINLAKAEADESDASKRYGHLVDAVVLNNHYDTDGALSVFACLHPSIALRHKDLLISAAAAGDFGEWISDAGVKLDCALMALKETCDTEAEAYDRALTMLPDLLQDMENSQQEGGKYESMWREEYDDAVAGYQDLLEGRALLSRGPGAMAILMERPGSERMSPYALHRGLVESDLWKGTTRVLRVASDITQSPDKSKSRAARYRYEYEKLGHGWVTKLKDRPVIPDADSEKLAKAMGGADADAGSWSKGGPSDFTSICHSTYVSDGPDEVSRKLWELDPGCQ